MANRKIPFISASIINKYIGCKYSFLDFYKNDGFNSYRQDGDEDEAIYLEFGKLIHGVIEQFWKLSKGRTKQFLIKTYENDIVNQGFNDKEYIETGYQMMEYFWDYVLNIAPKRKMLHSELSFNVNINKTPLHGTIDAIFYLGDGIYEIEDYKTSRIVKTQSEADEDIQLSMYDLIFSDKQMSEYWFNGIEPKGIILTLNYLRHNVRVQTERTSYSRINTRSYFRLIYNQMNILDDKKMKPNINSLCRFCDCASRCPAYNSVLENEPMIENISDDALNDLHLYKQYDSYIKILETERSYHYDKVKEYLSQKGVSPLEYDGYLYYLSQGGKRYVNKNKAIEVLKENGLWEEFEQQFVSIPITAIDKIIKENPQIEDELSRLISFTYYQPSLKTEKAPKLFKRSGGGNRGKM